MSESEPIHHDAAGIVRRNIASRRSCRSYLDKPVPKRMLDELVQAAVMAPFSVGCHALRLMVITDIELLGRLSDAIKRDSLDFRKKGRLILRRKIPFVAPRGIVPFLNFPTVMRQFMAAMDGERDVWWGAPALILVCTVPDASPTYEIDVSLATQNVLLMAHALGLGTCVLKCPELISFYPDLKQLVDLAPRWVVCMGVAVGFPKTQVEHLPVPPRPSATDPEFVQWRSTSSD